MFTKEPRSAEVTSRRRPMAARLKCIYHVVDGLTQKYLNLTHEARFPVLYYKLKHIVEKPFVFAGVVGIKIYIL
jgi:hypothetical protein